MSTSKLRHRAALAALVPMALAAGCSSQGGGGETTTEEGKVAVSLWTHSAGNPAELTVSTRSSTDFNASQDEYEVQQQEPSRRAAYNDAIVARRGIGRPALPPRPRRPDHAQLGVGGYLQPLELPTELTGRASCPAVGARRTRSTRPATGMPRSLIFARKSVLDKNGIRIPTIDEPWTEEEFDAALGPRSRTPGLRRRHRHRRRGRGEWWPYAYSPMLQSFGGDLIDRDTMLDRRRRAQRPEAVAGVRQWFQDLFETASAQVQHADRNQEFVDGEVALSYTASGTTARLEIGDDL